MVWIRTVPEGEAKGTLKRYYEGAKAKRGFLAETLTVFSIKENNLRATQSLSTTLMEGGSGLRRPEKEMIAVRVSTLNGCDY